MWLNSSINFHMQIEALFCYQFSNFTDLGQEVSVHLLPTPAWSNKHDRHLLDLREQIADLINLSFWVQSNSHFGAHVTKQHHGRRSRALFRAESLTQIIFQTLLSDLAGAALREAKLGWERLVSIF